MYTKKFFEVTGNNLRIHVHAMLYVFISLMQSEVHVHGLKPPVVQPMNCGNVTHVLFSLRCIVSCQSPSQLLSRGI
jgi:hypothetical protein